MDIELIAWIIVFVGGYLVVLGYLLRTAISKSSGRDDSPAA
jgi:hypothetical protein